MNDPRRQAVIEEAVSMVARVFQARSVSKAEALAMVAAAMAGGASEPAQAETPREQGANIRQLRRQHMLAELARYEQEGRGREAPMLVARAFAKDPHDPIEVESLARSMRRWRSKKNGQCPATSENFR